MSWLPRGFEFLSGLPEDKRRRRNIVVIQAFADDSGVQDGHSTVLVLASLVGSSQEWAEFSDEWAFCLRQSPAIRYLKMSEAAKLRKEFWGWSESARDAKLRALARVLNRRRRLVCWEAFELKAAEVAADVGEPFNQPYFWCFNNLIRSVSVTLWEAGVRERFEMTFDEQVIQGLKAREWYPSAKYVTKAFHPGAFTILPTDVVFKTDNEFLPLQAADIWAWCVRYSCERRLTSESEKSEHQFAWLLDEFSNVMVSKHCAFSTREAFIASRVKGENLELSPEQEEMRRGWYEAAPKRKHKKPKRKG